MNKRITLISLNKQLETLRRMWNETEKMASCPAKMGYLWSLESAINFAEGMLKQLTKP